MVKSLMLTILLTLGLVFPWKPHDEHHARVDWRWKVRGEQRAKVDGSGPRAEQRTRLDGWTLDVRLDRFTYRRICTLRRDQVYYERHALVFHLPWHWDTSRAAYRIDNGAPRWVTADAMDLVRLGFALHDDSLANPSGSVVRVTLTRLAGGGQVDIEPKPFGSSWRRFNVNGYQAALAMALTKCGEDDFDRPTDMSN